jgi:hypothetical protein
MIVTMDVKTTIRQYLVPVRMDTTKAPKVRSVGEAVERFEPCALTVGM